MGSDFAQVHRVQWKPESGFKCYRYENTKPLNSYSSINFEVLSELYDRRLNGLDEGKVDHYIYKIRSRIIDQMMADYEKMLQSLRLNESDANDALRPPSSIHDHDSDQDDQIKPLSSFTNQQPKMLNRGNLLVLPFDTSAIDNRVQLALKQHIILQYILDSRKAIKDSEGTLEQNFQRFGQFYVDTFDSKISSSIQNPGFTTSGAS